MSGGDIDGSPVWWMLGWVMRECRINVDDRMVAECGLASGRVERWRCGWWRRRDPLVWRSALMC
eukprot:9793218-Prorocentrum_lima.AAC.1